MALTVAGNPMENALILLQQFGFFNVVLPLLLVFAIFYGILQKTELFGESSKSTGVNAIVSLVAAFLVISNTTVVESITKLLPQASLLLIIALLGLMLLAFVGFQPSNLFSHTTYFGKAAAIVLVLVFLVMLDISFGTNYLSQIASSGSGAGSNIDSETATTWIVLALMLALPALTVYFLKPRS